MDRQFDLLARNETAAIEVRSLLHAYRDGWLERRMNATSDEENVSAERVSVAEPEHLVQFPFRLFEHQKAARRKWASAGGRGLLAMATGSGKTITALSIASSLYDALEERWLCILIIAPFIHLVDQWIEVRRWRGAGPDAVRGGEREMAGRAFDGDLRPEWPVQAHSQHRDDIGHATVRHVPGAVASDPSTHARHR